MMGTVTFDYAALNSILLQDIESLLEEWLPGGKLGQKEYICGGPEGGEGHSLSINLATGKWAEFATDDRGGDLISLYAFLRCNGDQGEAYKELSKGRMDLPLQPLPAKPTPKKDDDLKLGLPPEDAPPPDIPGTPSRVHVYRDSGGRPIHYTVIYMIDGKKSPTPKTWSEVEGAWINKHFPKPRPLYNLDLLEKYPDAKVMIVEGEKCADALSEISLPHYVPVTWAGGASSWRLADWKPVKGRSVCLWPDADQQQAKRDYPEQGIVKGDLLPYNLQPGVRCMEGIGQRIFELVPELKIFNVEGMPDKWDAADALEDGMGWKELLAWGKPRVRTIQHELPKGLPKLPTKGVATTEELRASVYDYWAQMGIEINTKGGPVKGLKNACRALENWTEIDGNIWYDEFHQRMFTTWKTERREWRDDDDLRIAHYMQDILMLPFDDHLMKKAVRLYARNRTRNEPKEWLESLEWDGQDRIDYVFTDGFGADKDSPYVMQASRNWFMSMAARVLMPGCQVDNMIILQGRQGTFKSTALRVIGGNWYASMTDCVNNKDFFISLEGKLVVEIGEMDAFGKADIQRIKNIITNPSDRYRSPFDVHSADHPRQCVFAGTTNEQLILRDHTGARRFWPIKCGLIDIPWLRENRDQLFAEACHRVKQGENWHEMPMVETEEEQEKRRQHDPWEDDIAEWLHLAFGQDLTNSVIMKEALHLDTKDRDHPRTLRVNRCMKVLGYVTKVKKIGGKTTRVYVKEEDDGSV
jgi:hypothetical protein